MASPKDGKAGTAVSPVEPKAAKEAVVADPGEAFAAEARESQKQPAQRGTTKVPAHKPTAEENKKKKSWLEIELNDQDGEPVAGEPYEVRLPDGTAIASGTLDEHGRARIENIDPGTGKVTFPRRDASVWSKK